MAFIDAGFKSLDRNILNPTLTEVQDYFLTQNKSFNDLHCLQISKIHKFQYYPNFTPDDDNLFNY